MQIAGIAEISFPYSLRPSEITACLKTSVMPGDKVYVIVSFFQGDSILASPGDCSFVIDSSINDFTCLTFPITYQSALIPDSANIMIVAGSNTAQSGTEIIVDELSFGFSSGISDAPGATKNGIRSFPNPANNYTYIPVELSVKSDVKISVYDLKGAFIQTVAFPSLNAGSHNCKINTTEMAPGVYSFSIKNSGIQHGRFSVSR
jgi:hypothetical protein